MSGGAGAWQALPVCRVKVKTYSFVLFCFVLFFFFRFFRLLKTYISLLEINQDATTFVFTIWSSLNRDIDIDKVINRKHLRKLRIFLCFDRRKSKVVLVLWPCGYRLLTYILICTAVAHPCSDTPSKHKIKFNNRTKTTVHYDHVLSEGPNFFMKKIVTLLEVSAHTRTTPLIALSGSETFVTIPVSSQSRGVLKYFGLCGTKIVRWGL